MPITKTKAIKQPKTKPAPAEVLAGTLGVPPEAIVGFVAEAVALENVAIEQEIAAKAATPKKAAKGVAAAEVIEDGPKPLTDTGVLKLLTSLREDQLLGLVNYYREMTTDADLTDWRRAFPSVFGELNDAEASAVIRVAVAIAGGVAE